MCSVYAREDFDACGELGEMQLTRARALGILGASPLAFTPLPVRAADAAPIRIGAESSEPFMEPFYAQVQGFFTRNGVTATTESVSSYSQPMGAAAANIGTQDRTLVRAGSGPRWR